MSKIIYRYFSRKYRPSDIPPIGDIINVVDYETPVDSGNGKMMYGYIDYSLALHPVNAEEYGLEYAPINPITLPDA